MTRVRYVSTDIGREIAAPSGYYQPVEETSIDYGGRRLLYVVGLGCIEASCCGVGSWQYVRVEGYVTQGPPFLGEGDGDEIEIEIIEDEGEKAEIRALLVERYPGARVEFR